MRASTECAQPRFSIATVFNVDHGYTFKPDDLELVPTAAAAVRLLNEAGYYVIVVTNQSGVARGLYPEAAVKAFNAHLQDALLADGAVRCVLLLPAPPGGNDQGAGDPLSVPQAGARHARTGGARLADRPQPQPPHWRQGPRLGGRQSVWHSRHQVDAKAGTLEDLVRKTLASEA